MTAAIAGNRCFFRHPTAAGPLGETPSRLRVLVAEDDEPNQLVLRIMLERRGYSVRIVANGRLVLAALDEESFDLLLLDVRMPEMDGWQVAKSLRSGERENPGCRRLPIIALTAMAQKSDRDRCMQAGMDEYLSKPLHAADLYATLDRVLARPAQHFASRTFSFQALLSCDCSL
jgi:two-component system sensor histidine kinase/response regulator